MVLYLNFNVVRKVCQFKSGSVATAHQIRDIKGCIVISGFLQIETNYGERYLKGAVIKIL